MDPVAAVSEAEAQGATAAIFADIRHTLGVEVVNLIWRHLATMPAALPWVWHTLKPLYLGAGIGHAEEVRLSLRMPQITSFSEDTLSAAGLASAARANVRAILDSYYHTNALALVAFSALLERFENGAEPTPSAIQSLVTGKAQPPSRVALPRLTPLSELDPSITRLVGELNSFGEDNDLALVASMYRHLSHWPAYLALVRTLLAPLHRSGELKLLVAATRRLGREHGQALAPLLSNTDRPPETAGQALMAVRRFVEHPIARMTGVCALIRSATPA